MGNWYTGLNNLDKIEIAKYVPKNAIRNYYKVDYFNYLKYKIIHCPFSIF